MDKNPDEPQTEPRPAQGDEDKPPPFDPDPRIVTYLERGRKSDAEQRFREAIQEQGKER